MYLLENYKSNVGMFLLDTSLVEWKKTEEDFIELMVRNHNIRQEQDEISLRKYRKLEKDQKKPKKRTYPNPSTVWIFVTATEYPQTSNK